jgi:hypothetical protein
MQLSGASKAIVAVWFCPVLFRPRGSNSGISIIWQLSVKKIYGSFALLYSCNIPRLNRINSILIPLSYNFFSGSPSAKNSRVKRAWPGAISEWVTD